MRMCCGYASLGRSGTRRSTGVSMGGRLASVIGVAGVAGVLMRGVIPIERIQSSLLETAMCAAIAPTVRSTVVRDARVVRGYRRRNESNSIGGT